MEYNNGQVASAGLNTCIVHTFIIKHFFSIQLKVSHSGKELSSSKEIQNWVECHDTKLGCVYSVLKQNLNVEFIDGYNVLCRKESTADVQTWVEPKHGRLHSRRQSGPFPTSSAIRFIYKSCSKGRHYRLAIFCCYLSAASVPYMVRKTFDRP